MLDSSDKQQLNLIKTGFAREFRGRIVVENNKRADRPEVFLTIDELPEALLFRIQVDEVAHCISIPVPQVHNGVHIVESNEVKRALCKFYKVETGQNLDYLTMITQILFSGPEALQGILPDMMIKKYPSVQQIAFAITQGRAGLAIHHIQRCINEVINKMPLYTTPMNAHIMNKRIYISDPAFDALTDPKAVHAYQIQKSRKYFDQGLSPLGQSDGAMADKNYILSQDLRYLSPFAIKHHNPMRNLYSSLGMKGDELPMVRSRSMQNLIDEGITRTGWNLFTVFLDTKDVWEDQILVDVSHLDKFVAYTKRYQCYGNLEVKEGDVLKHGQILSKVDEDNAIKFAVVCDYATVKSISSSSVSVGGIITEVNNVIVEYRRGFKDGVKITNLAANKGVIRFKELGYATDPRTEELRKIDVIVSCKAVLKRKNFSQVIEAVWNNCRDDETQSYIFEDDAEFTTENLETLLESKGFPKDGTWECNTYAGKFNCVCGTVFWGVTHDAEDTVWENNDTTRLNGRELRQAGLKFSAIELRALETRFGKDNPVTEEVLSYAQGGQDLHEKFNILRSMVNQLPDDVPVVDLDKVKYVGKSEGSIVPADKIKGTVVDEDYFPMGFILKLPVTYQILLDEKGNVKHEGFPVVGSGVDMEAGDKVHNIDKIYVPFASLRKCWKHATGRFGLSDIGSLVNSMVELGNLHLAQPEDPQMYKLMFGAISRYFSAVTKSLGSKKGDISVYGMAVRYPHSAKAVATLSNSLPKNTIEIHQHMAEQLNLVDGDVVLVERFPCLGFMSLRPQAVKITNDPLCRYSIRVSGNSLGSLSLDFDGDVIYIAAFYTKAAKKLLKLERSNPNKSCYEAIKELNAKMGHPSVKAMALQDYEVSTFEPLTVDTHAEIVEKLAGVKNNTGPVIALSYNIMRIVENSDIKANQKTNVAVELFTDRVANSIFKQKHGAKALHEVVVDAVCSGDVDALVDEGFARNTSMVICDTIRKKAASIGVNNLAQYHEVAKTRGSGNIITRIVREQNKIYFASRAQLDGIALLNHLEEPAVDVPSRLLRRNLKGDHRFQQTTLDKQADERLLGRLKHVPGVKDTCRTIFGYLDKILWGCTIHVKVKKNRFNLTPRNKYCNICNDSIENRIGGLNYGRQKVLGDIA